MQRWKSYAAVALAAAGVTACIQWLILSRGSDRWQPTGDGRTIVNARTGELRLTKSGALVRDPAIGMTVEAWRPIAADNGTHYHAAQRSFIGASALEIDRIKYRCSIWAPAG